MDYHANAFWGIKLKQVAWLNTFISVDTCVDALYPQDQLVLLSRSIKIKKCAPFLKKAATTWEENLVYYRHASRSQVQKQWCFCRCETCPLALTCPFTCDPGQQSQLRQVGGISNGTKTKILSLHSLRSNEEIWWVFFNHNLFIKWTCHFQYCIHKIAIWYYLQLQFFFGKNKKDLS